MDCSICFDEIEASKGQVTLGCQHHFHLGCIGRWILKNETCPMCRHETSEKEKILNTNEELQWDDDDEDEEEEEDEGMDATDIPEFNEAAHALWVMRKTFEMIEDGQSISTETDAGTETKSADRTTLENSLELVRERSQRWCLSLYADESRGYESA